MTTIDAAVKVGQRRATDEDRIAAEWGLTLRRLCSTRAGSVTGIYLGRFKVADYSHETHCLMIGSEQRHAASLFDAIMAVAGASMERSESLPSWLRL